MKNQRSQPAEVSAAEKNSFNATNRLNDVFPETLPPVLPAMWSEMVTRAYDALLVLLESPQNQADYRQVWRLAASVKSLEYLGWVFFKGDIVKPFCRRPITGYGIKRSHPANQAAFANRVAQCTSTGV